MAGAGTNIPVAKAQKKIQDFVKASTKQIPPKGAGGDPAGLKPDRDQESQKIIRTGKCAGDLFMFGEQGQREGCTGNSFSIVAGQCIIIYSIIHYKERGVSYERELYSACAGS